MMHSSLPILCLNSGSSSLKFALYLIGDDEEILIAGGEADHIGPQGGRLRVLAGEREISEDLTGDFMGHQALIRMIFAVMESLDLQAPAAVGHRLVHGGPFHAAPAKVNKRLIEELRGLAAFAPLHLPNEIRLIEAAAEHCPDIPQVACFDTAFHRRMPELAQRLPLPREFWDEGLRRYGFHGLSYEYVLDELGEAGRGRTVIAHLGNGASMAAVKSGQPVDTTMGFTPAGGFMMGTRSGDLDPGVLVYLINEKGYDADGIERLVNRQAGLLGVSGISPDMKTLLEKRKSDPYADQAVEMFCYQIRKQTGALAAALGGLDMLVFTGGIGEKAAPVRQSICKGLSHLGVSLDPALNEAHAGSISTPESPCTVKVVPTNEDLIIARHTRRILMES
jgi:acetate kinase